MKSRAMTIIAAITIFNLFPVSAQAAKDSDIDRSKAEKYILMKYDDVIEELKCLSPEQGYQYATVLAYAQMARENISGCQAYSNYALSIAQKNGLPKAMALLLLGIAHDTKGDASGCMSYLSQAVMAARQENNKGLLKNSLSSLASAAYRYGNFEDSFRGYNELIALCTDPNDEPLKAQTFFDLSEVQCRLGNIDDANKTATQAIMLFSKNQNYKGLAGCYKVLGNVWAAKGSPAKAQEFYIKAKTAYENTSDFHGQGNCYFNLGILCRDSNEYEKAAEHLKDAVFCYTKSGSTEGVGIAQMELGRTLYLKGDYGQAQLALKQACDLLTRSNSKFRLAQTFEYLGDLKAAQHETNEEMALYSKAADYFKNLRLTADQDRVEKKLANIKLPGPRRLN